MLANKSTTMLRRMLLEQNKNNVSAYLGFSIKNRSMIFGLDNILSCHKHLYVIVVGDDLTEKNLSKILTFAQIRKCTLSKVGGTFGMLINRPTCKLAGVTDKHLAQAIINCCDTIYKGEI